MKKFPIVYVLFFFFLFAGGVNSAPNSREGFFFGVGGSGSSEIKGVKKTYAGFHFRVGAGITDQVLVYGHSYINQYDPNGSREVRVQGLEAGSSVYFLNGNSSSPYVMAGIGIGFDSYHPSNNSVGVSVSAGVGYEFRFGKLFALQPEFTFHLVRDDGNQYHMINYGLMGAWYF